MKIRFLILLLVFLPTISRSQTYVSFPKDSATWNVEFIAYQENPTTPKFILFGDTLINGKLYSKLYQQLGNIAVYDPTNKIYYGGIREDSLKRIWFIGDAYSCQNDTLEFLLYDFNLSAGDTMIITNCSQWQDSMRFAISNIDSILIGNTFRKRYTYDMITIFGNNWGHWIEGIGSDHGPIHHLCNEFESSNSLLCFSIKDSIIYQKGNYCFIYPSVEEIEGTPSQIIYPNPFTISATVEFTNYDLRFTNLEFVLYDQLGRELLRFGVQRSTFDIQRNGLPAGIYFYSLQSKGQALARGKLVAIGN